ncbi:AraC family transcriptional regulator [Pedobacter sp. MC2016-14]|uniref:AraC family transcriptional regulator n=1 Tax=Pedobacter sp. MC2016-14 TaxID=2897327 RepID=UPI001E46B1EE|nr:AraC family transcriptional regulator [Pedobacter sp. MC2016-14]MCD0488950.1 AraC family transcriptional regulator [Pedobacter sp. MC2016-14]
MKPQLLKISRSPAQSFSVRHDLKPSMNNKFHYHPEVELIHFVQGRGTQFIGDSITEFGPGDLVLVGGNLPHYWRFDQDGGTITATDVKVAHFSEGFPGEYFLNLPENKPLKDILEKSRRGIKVLGSNKQRIIEILGLMLESEGADRLIYLIQALLEIAKSDRLQLLSSVGFVLEREEGGNNRIKDVYEYSFANFRNNIHLDDIAGIAGISTSSFCRYFKSVTHKTYSQFLAEIKVGHACKLLIDNRLNMKQVCSESGFNNLASFHKSFKNITGKSPLAYQKEFTL